MKLYNSRTRKIETFTPLSDNTVKMYVCGITPDGPTHLGHAFTYTIFDILNRYLRYKGYKVTYTQNLTDVDNEILKRSAKAGQPWKPFELKWSAQFLKDYQALNLLMPDYYVKASDTVPEIIKIVKVLQERGFAYEVSGNVYFNVKKFPDYGKLSRYNWDQMVMIAAERGGAPNNPEQKNPLDFVLWQCSSPTEPRWPSPWGWGRPGWHIECSAMVCHYLGTQIDIHGGGHDLIFPHHESEIAQSESYTGKKPYVNFWMHTAMLQYEGEKMSKSLGNLVIVSELLKNYSANAIRWVLLSHHYREAWEFRYEELDRAEQTVETIFKSPDVKANQNSPLQKQFEHLMDDDLNTPAVLKILEKAPSIKIMDRLGFTTGGSLCHKRVGRR